MHVINILDFSFVSFFLPINSGCKVNLKFYGRNSIIRVNFYTLVLRYAILNLQTTTISSAENIYSRIPSLPESRKAQRIITRLRIGHIKYRFQFLTTEQPLCHNCNTNLTIKHIVQDCSAFRDPRQKDKNPMRYQRMFE